ncbi:MAG: S1 family peptidase [Myxococcales bacterium]|nr:S1 family peptidase [Myxococcales bacterium]
MLTFGLPSLIKGGGNGIETGGLSLSEAIRIRSEVGFDTNPELVGRILLQREPGSRGSAFTDDELLELKRRDELLERLEPALSYLDERKSDFGGHYFDQSSGDMLLVVNVLATTREADIDAFRQLLPADAATELHEASISQAALERLRDELYFALPFDLAKTAYIDPRQNVVVLTVSAAHVAEAQRLASEQDASVVVGIGSPVVGNACVSRSSCEVPWRGGTVLSGCTWGFNARPTTTSTTRWVLSSGHCSHLGDLMTHDGAVVTTSAGVNRNTFDLSAPTSESMRAPLQVDAGARNLVYISSGNMAYPITSKASTSTQTVGVGIAISGRSSLYIEGTIQAVDLLASVCRDAGECYTVKVFRATYSTQPGDSGAPVISRTLPKAFGIHYGHAGAGDPRGLYTPIDRVLLDMGARLCLDAGCN